MSEIKLNESQLDERLSKLEQARAWNPRVISKLETFIRSAPDADLFRVNPVQYAMERNISESEALDLFLYAAKVGLFEMDWHIVCPHCGFVVDSLQHMSQLRNHYLCPICGSDRDYALDDYIQVAFSISSLVRGIPYHHPETLSIEDLYLNYLLSKDVISPIPVFPTWKEAIIAVAKYLGYVEPGEKVSVDLELPPGILRATDTRTSLQLSLIGDRTTQASLIQLRLKDGKFKSDNPGLQSQTLIMRTADHQPVQFRFDVAGELPCGKVVIELENMQDRRCALCIYNPGELPTPFLPLRPSLSGKKLLTTQTFSDLFRSEVVHANETLTIKEMTYLFTDLKGSTAMYEKIGDAKALFLVHQHFDVLTSVIRERRGAIVKTIGDAVMAVFESPIEATNAALGMIDALQALNQTIPQELILKIGIHLGYSIALTVNDRVDYFGQNVNIAARVQSLADANEVYVTADVYNSPGVSDALKTHRVTPDEVAVKGISEKLQVYKICHHHSS
jgi:class 3 adenylate cyclase